MTWTIRYFTPCELCESTGVITVPGEFDGETEQIECPKCKGDGRTEDYERVYGVPAGCTAFATTPVHLALVSPTIDPYDPFAEEVTA